MCTTRSADGWSCGPAQVPLLVQAAVFTAFTLSGGNLTPALAFPSLALLNQLSLPLFFLPDQIGSFVQGRVSLGRIQAFLNEAEMEQQPLQPPAAAGCPAISVKHGVYSWEPGQMLQHRQIAAMHSHACELCVLHACMMHRIHAQQVRQGTATPKPPYLCLCALCRILRAMPRLHEIECPAAACRWASCSPGEVN